MGEKLSKDQLTAGIKDLSIQLGFDACGISKVYPLETDFDIFEKWISNGHHANMDWITKYTEKRKDPSLLLDGAKSVISFIHNYYQDYNTSENQYRIARYALGRDYHKVLKKKLFKIIDYINTNSCNNNSRAFVDSAPVLEHAWARKSGLGWIGKHSLLINRKIGSYFFICEIVTTAELVYSQTEERDFCGSCERCIRACPTNAILDGRIVDANKCISYHTIENKGTLPDELKEKFGNWVFGCDICQDVCPFNKKPINTEELQFVNEEKVSLLETIKDEELNEEKFKSLFAGTPVMRTKYEGFKRNVSFVKNNLKRS
jgi:epoxyqueuosine reductase